MAGKARGMTDARQYLTTLASEYQGLDAGHRDTHNAAARIALEGLHELLPDLTDDQLARVSYTVANMTKALSAMTVSDLALTLENSQLAYALAAASLMGIYDTDAAASAASTEPSGTDYDDSGAYL